MARLGSIKTALIEGRHIEVAELVGRSLEDGTPPGEILNQALVPGMDVVGERFGKREIFLPDVLLSARAMYAGLELLKPHLGEQSGHRRGTVVLGTVEGDLHDIGKNLVGIMLSGAGFEVIDLGNNVSPEAFVQAVQERKADVVGMSALLTTTMPGMGRVLECLKQAGLDKVRSVVGGAPLSENFAREIGADAYGYDASRAVALVRGFVE